MSFFTSVVPMNDVVIIHLYADDDTPVDVVTLRKKMTSIYNERVGFAPDKGDTWSTKEWKMYDSFLLWLTEAWETAEKDYYPSNGAFVVTDRTTGRTSVFILDVSTYRAPGQICGVHTYNEFS